MKENIVALVILASSVLLLLLALVAWRKSRRSTEQKQAGNDVHAARELFELAVLAVGLDPWENNFITGERTGGEKIFFDLGYKRDEIPQTIEKFYLLVHPDDLPGLKQSLTNHIVGRSTLYTADFRLQDRTGDYHWFSNYGRVVERDSDGKPIRLIGLTLNINDRKKNEEKIKRQNEALQKVNAEKDKFFSIIAHDLKGPFQGFIGLTEMMSEGIVEMPKEDLEDIAKTLLFTAKNLYELLENLLNWALIKRGGKRFYAEKIRLKSAADSVISILTHQASQKNHSISNDIDANIDVLADREIVKTIFRNLLSNAIKFTPKGGSITLASHKDDHGFVQISIQDNGIGIPEEIIENLFKINKKVSRPGTEQEPSTGLGLILCKEFIEKHGGRIWVESMPQKGSTFYFTLPSSD
ncbi:MAG TPA: PAS domain-containing sensor histidine kinase [Tenuifilaceae bacterium]|nr:PAS domain-containing protein [Bacteroidales bacterium]HNS28936.1 PAS domain-containing sensor histidine kinase [Tenuifilaceae bacterium]HNV81198.1 PAS domain-containing sensor histidine kinase [Tenuifilaceae bacterium]HPW49091.1 PAS domain-containing sensor histidine kinase [Tenuifilaceae bacterium]